MLPPKIYCLSRDDKTTSWSFLPVNLDPFKSVHSTLPALPVNSISNFSFAFFSNTPNRLFFDSQYPPKSPVTLPSSLGLSTIIETIFSVSCNPVFLASPRIPRCNVATSYGILTRVQAVFELFLIPLLNRSFPIQ